MPRKTQAEMVDPSSAAAAEYVELGELSCPKQYKYQRVSVIPLAFLIFYEVSGGPFGIEVQAAGPLLTLLGFLLVPFAWSMPEALITAELGTMFPENGGYVVWVSSALGPYWGFQQGWMKWLSGVIDNALYPVLFLDYLKSAIPELEGGLPRSTSVLALTVVLTYMSYRGLNIVGWVAIFLGVFSLLPFIFMGFVAVPRLNASRWFVMDVGDVNWSLYLNTLFWNLNYWDSISTLAGEVENPSKTLPKSLFYALLLVFWGTFFLFWSVWGRFHSIVSFGPMDISLTLVKCLEVSGCEHGFKIQSAAVLSNMGMFLAEMSSDSFQLEGMATRGMLPELFAKRSPYGTPLVGILFSASGVILLSWMSFHTVSE